MQHCESVIAKEPLDDFNVDISTYLKLLGSFQAAPNEIGHHTDFEDCVFEVFTEYNLKNLYLKGLTFHLYNITHSNDFLEEATKTQRFFIHQALDICDIENHGKKFDRLPRGKKSKNAADLCVREYLFNNGFINQEQWGISYSRPVEDAQDCEDVIAELEEPVKTLNLNKLTFFGWRAPTASACINQRVKSLKLKQDLKAIEVLLSDYSFSTTQMEALREEFIVNHTNINEILINCIAIDLKNAES